MSSLSMPNSAVSVICGNMGFFGGSHVGTAFEQGRGQSGGQVLRQAIDVPVGLPGYFPGKCPGEQGNLVFLDGDGAFEVGHEGGGAGELHAGLLEGGLRGEPAFKTQTGKPHSFLSGSQGLTHNGELVVEGYQFKVGLCHLCYEAHLQGSLVFDGFEQFGFAPLGSPAEFPPQVDLPRQYGAGMELGVVAVIVAAVIGRVFIGIEAAVDLRQYLADVDAAQGSQLFDAGRGGEHVLVVFERLGDEVLQDGVGVHGPPVHVGNREGVGKGSGGVYPFGQCHLGSGIFFPDLARGYRPQGKGAEQ